MDVDQPWLKHGVISERGTVCRELTIFLAMPYPYQRLRINERPLTFDDAPKGWVAVKFRVEGQTNFRFILTTMASCSDQVHCIIY